METATFAGGCFWCTEAIFKKLKGVTKVTSGYAGGDIENPSYEQVSHGNTGYAEAIQIDFDPKKISYTNLLYVFFRMHDPTQMNRQGADEGEQYRSIVFYSDEEQRQEALEAVAAAQKEYQDKIVTQIVPYKNFFKAEGYHQDYYEKNKSLPYCRLVIDPKIKKLEKDFGKYLK